MFGRIARRYDLMNTLMTAGLDRGWRVAAARAASSPPDGLALDVGTGTARLGAVLASGMSRGRVIGVDFALPMLQAGQVWLWHREVGEVALVAADGLALPFRDSQFDCATSAFSVRNLADLDSGFREQARVLKPGGRVVCLELAWPLSPLMQPLFRLYFGQLVPLLGQLIARDRAAYSYLPASVRAFPAPAELASIMCRAGLVDVRWRRMGLGTVTLHVGSVPWRAPATPASGCP
jgi:demethylmenaquinone methyltransferase/2-methoxy-6-polyprenyl-1,4-benzoquinol methylase